MELNQKIRARNAALHLLKNEFSLQLKQSPGNKIINQNLSLVRNGVFPIQVNKEAKIKEQLKETISSKKLDFVELTTYSSFFELHPKKVCGEEEFTTSRDFPVRIVGTKSLTEKVIRDNTIAHSKKALELEKTLESL